MDPTSSLGRIFLGENIIKISSDKVEGYEDWNSLEYQDTANSGGKKETKAMVFYKMDIEEVSYRFVAPWNKVVKKELIVALRGELYFVKFIINPEEDDVEPRVIFGRSFLRLTKAITDFRAGTVTIYPKLDPFLDDFEKIEKSLDDWDQLLDFNFDDIPQLDGERLLQFVCKMGKSNRNKKRAMENLNLFYQDIGPSSSTRGHLTQEEAAKEALAIKISQKFALLEEVRPVLETMAYHNKYKKVLDEIWKDKVELDGMIVKEEEEAITKVQREALKEKDDPGAFIFPIRLEGRINENALADTGSDINTMSYRIYEKLGREEIKKVNRGITMINHTQAEAMGVLTNVLCQVGVTALIAQFLILDIPIDHDALIVVSRRFIYIIGGIVNTPERLFLTFDGVCHQTFCAARSDFLRTAESDSDDEEEYEIMSNKFRAPIYGPKPAAYVNFSFLGSLPAPLQQVDWKPYYKGCYTNEEEAKGQWRTEIRVTDLYGNIYMQACTTKKTSKKLLKYHKLSDIIREAKSRYNTKLANLLPRHVYSSCVMNWDILNRMGCDGEIDEMLRIKVHEAGTNEEIFTFVAWIRAFNIKEPIYSELCHDLTLLEFAQRLGLYHVDKLDEDGFDVYFQGGLYSDEHFNAQEYWLSISREENLSLSNSHVSTIRYPILRVTSKWVCECGLVDCEVDEEKGSWYSERESDLLWTDITKIAMKARVLTDEVIRCLSALIYCRDLNTTTLIELIDSEGRLIPEDPQPGVPRLGIL
ncbi:ribonuclease H-like domain-containing protein, partial [Tanacetum coccineum]